MYLVTELSELTNWCWIIDFSNIHVMCMYNWIKFSNANQYYDLLFWNGKYLAMPDLASDSLGSSVMYLIKKMWSNTSVVIKHVHTVFRKVSVHFNIHFFVNFVTEKVFAILWSVNKGINSSLYVLLHRAPNKQILHGTWALFAVTFKLSYI
jgi:hypothetical protein